MKEPKSDSQNPMEGPQKLFRSDQAPRGSLPTVPLQWCVLPPKAAALLLSSNFFSFYYGEFKHIF